MALQGSDELEELEEEYALPEMSKDKLFVHVNFKKISKVEGMKKSLNLLFVAFSGIRPFLKEKQNYFDVLLYNLKKLPEEI